MQFKDIATVAGKPGLYKVLKPTRGGVILETLDEKKAKLIAGANHRVSVLSEISMYTMDEDGAKPLENILIDVEKEFKGDLGLDGTADPDELRAFMKHILPDVDESKVYPSDIKKLVSWYQIIRTHAPELLEDPKEEASDADAETEN
jgi:hypothetical protein